MQRVFRYTNERPMTNVPHDTRRKLVARYAWFVPALGVVLLSGCMTLEEMAPSVGPHFTTEARGRSVAVATLERGRTVYLTDCTRCHSVEPIGRYSTAQWEDIVPRMAVESKLDESRTQALRAYVLAAHEVLARRAEAGN